MTKPRFPGFADCMGKMRKRNAATAEEGFHWLLPRAAEFVEPLMAEFRQERDHGLRCWLLELISEARDPRALGLLVEQLHASDESLRSWAARGLQMLDTHDARKARFGRGCTPNRGEVFANVTLSGSAGKESLPCEPGSCSPSPPRVSSPPGA